MGGLSLPVMQIREKAILIYDQPQQLPNHTYNKLAALRMQEARKTRYSGVMSDGVRKRLTRAVTLLVQSSPKRQIYNTVSKRYQQHQVSFITLTVSDPDKKLTGKEAHKKLLAPFLQWLRRRENVNTYVWKAELQKNKQIHYHITTPNFVHWQKIRDTWNNLQRKQGLLDSYAAKKGHYDANSTDIHSVKMVNNLASYIVKYVTKSYQNETDLGGKVWDCSENLKGKKYFTVEMTQEHQMIIENDVIDGKADQFHGERFTIVKWKYDIVDEILCQDDLDSYVNYLRTINPGSAQRRIRHKRRYDQPHNVTKQQKNVISSKGLSVELEISNKVFSNTTNNAIF